MRFGKSAKEAAEEPGRAGSGGDFIRYLKDGDTTFRLLQEPDDWTYYWEHFSPMGFSFPCSNEDDCYGCVSDNEKMKKAQRRIAFNVIQGYNGTDYVNVFKVGSTVADKLKNRFNRFGTVTDRDYTVTRIKTGDRYDFDLDGAAPTPVDVTKFELKDVEALLQSSWDEAWGEGGQGTAGVREPRNPKPDQPPAQKRITIAPQPKSDEPPFEPPETVYQEADLRAMTYEELVTLVKNDLGDTPPEGCTTAPQVVDWLLSIQP
jgi:hypothetical protein